MDVPWNTQIMIHEEEERQEELDEYIEENDYPENEKMDRKYQEHKDREDNE